MIATEDSLADVQTTLTLENARELPEWFNVGLYLLAGIFIVFGIGAVLTRVPRLDNRWTVTLLIIGLTLLGLTLRLWVASTNQRLLDMPATLIGDEPRYEHLAYSLLQGSFFQRPLATPVYPLFLAACYLIFGHSYGAVLIVQAFIGATAIPLTYRLSRNFIGKRSSLFAAMLIALYPCLIYQVEYLYTEVLYTVLLLLTLLSLLWALKAPVLHRFILGGIVLAISTLCRPATALMPPILFLFMPKTWNIKHRVALFCVFSGAMVAVIVPWTYHNYRTYNTFLPFSLSMTMLWHGSPEFYHLMKQQENVILKVWDEELNPTLNRGHDPLTIEGDRYFNARAMASIRAEPGLYVWYSLQKLAFFWIGHPASNYDWPFNFDVLRIYFSAGEIASIFGSRLLLVLAALSGLVVLRHRLRAFLPLLTVCGYFMLVYAILNPVARYSEPLYPILVIFVAAATSRLLLRYQVDLEGPAPHVETAPVRMEVIEGERNSHPVHFCVL
jgi:4-amino-4-deoxy-L-arabinose transferase-like glycosyltransferase